MNDSKARFRETCLRRLRALSASGKHVRDKRLDRRLQTVLKGLRPRSVLFYFPLEMEADVRGAMNAMRRRCRVYLPFMDGVSFKMVPFRLPLERKAFGIYESGNSHRKINKIDVAIVPAVGIDVQARRIGFGKGMYDRFFAKLKNRPYTIFVQPELCYTTEKLCDHYDVEADLVLTPRACFATMRTSDVKRNTLRRGHCHAERSRRFSHL